MKKQTKKTLWRGLTSTSAVLMVVSLFGTQCAITYTGTLNSYLGTTTSRIVSTGDPSAEDTNYYTSEFGDYSAENGTLIAQALGVPESVIALTFVALGTSLPELVTAITSLIKGHSDLSVGNVVGANVFNLVLVSGVSVTLAPFTIPQSSTLFGVNSSLVLDLPVMLAVMLIMTVPALVKGKMNRAQGIILLAIYAAFCAIQFTM